MSEHPKWVFRVEHILRSVEEILSYTENLSEEDFYKDIRTVRAVERCFQIMGEAAKHVPEEIRARYSDIPWQDMRKTRNFVTHIYEDVENNILWDTIKSDLGPLRTQLKKLLEKEND